MEVDQLPELHQGCNIEPRIILNLHAVAAMLVQHPVRNQKLITARKRDLHQARTERSTPSNQRYPLAKVGMMRVINLGCA
jgi:hypothetical protein